jgi:hypothetical protein
MVYGVAAPAIPSPGRVGRGLANYATRTEKIKKAKINKNRTQIYFVLP